MKLLVGLGNPGEKYENTRHNTGFIVLDKLLEDLTPSQKTVWQESKEYKSLVHEVATAGGKVMLAKPQTFMNNSGNAVKLLLDKNRLSSLGLTVIHDDVDLPFGKIRVRMGGAAGGHKGVMSIIDNLGTDRFLRIRLGIGRPIKIEDSKLKIENRGVEDYVLQEFESGEVGKLRTMVKETVRVVRLVLKEGIDQYMSKYNK